MNKHPVIAFTSIIILIIICDAQASEDDDFESLLDSLCSQPNTVYKECGNTCFESCGSSDLCPLYCKAGCFCKEGFKRHPNGKCVAKEKCPSCPNPNEAWLEEGDHCSEACDRAVKLCDKAKFPGCFCKPGFLRDPKIGLCIPENQCPEVGKDIFCAHTEVYKCGNQCWDHCDDGILRKCSGECRYGCYCRPEFKFDHKKGECVPEDMCPCVVKPEPVCNNQYEVFKYNGSACTDRCNKHLVKCAPDHNPGCYCIDGYARDLETGACRPYPCQDCGKNAEWVNCALDACDNECSFVLKEDHCKLNYIKCPDGCRCKKGFARSNNGTCIPESDCANDKPKPTTECTGPHEIYRKDGNPCTDRCNKDIVRCADQKVPGCYCKEGFARHLKTNVCVPYPCMSVTPQ